MRRKLFDYTASLISGIFIGVYCSQVQALVCISAGIVCLVLGIRRNKIFSERRIMVCFFLLGMILIILTEFGFTHGNLQRQALGDDEPTVMTGRITRIQCLDDESFRLTLDMNHEKLLCSYYARLEQPWALLGCMISFRGTIEEPEPAGNPRCFDYRRYLRTQEIGFVSTIESFDVVDGSPSLIYRVQRYILEKREGFLALFPDDASSKGLLRGILFGDTNQMNEELYNVFRQNGTAHVLAVSGLHIGMLYGIYRKIYERLHYGWITALFLVILLMYGTATLWSVSVTRAVILIVLVMIGNVLHRRYDLLTALATVALFVIVKNPYIIFGAGFQMSFLAVVSILFLQEPMERVLGRTLSASAAVQVGLMPYMAYVFNSLSLAGLICNIPVVFLTSLIVPVGITGFLLYFALNLSFPILNTLLDGLGQMLVFMNHLLSIDGLLSFDVISPPLWVITLIYGMLFYAASEQGRIYWSRRQWKEWAKPVAAIMLVSVIALFVGGSDFDQASVIFVDVGQGDCIHIKSDDRRTVLVDGGGKINDNVGEKILKPYLLKNGFSRVDLAAATHLHTDHYLGLEQLHACFDVDSIFTKGSAGDVIRLSSQQWLEILWPMELNPQTEDENLNSLIFMVHDGETKVLITGDITEEGEQMLIEQYRGTDRLQADILKIAHHGSAYSTSDAFLDAVQPKVAVISVGKNNYGHPSEIVIEKLLKKGIMVFRTDLDGAVGIINREGIISVCTEKRR